MVLESFLRASGSPGSFWGLQRCLREVSGRSPGDFRGVSEEFHGDSGNAYVYLSINYTRNTVSDH